jgi:hypothetical protein
VHLRLSATLRRCRNLLRALERDDDVVWGNCRGANDEPVGTTDIRQRPPPAQESHPEHERNGPTVRLPDGRVELISDALAQQHKRR